MLAQHLIQFITLYDIIYYFDLFVHFIKYLFNIFVFLPLHEIVNVSLIHEMV